MKRNLAIILLTSVALTSAACDESPTDLARGNTPVRSSGLRVQIVGPALVESAGEYEWTADVSGAEGETLAYEWSVYDLGGSDQITRSTDPVLLLSLDPERIGNLQIDLIVRTSTGRAYATEHVGVCAVRHEMEWCAPSRMLVQRR